MVFLKIFIYLFLIAGWAEGNSMFDIVSKRSETTGTIRSQQHQGETGGNENCQYGYKYDSIQEKCVQDVLKTRRLLRRASTNDENVQVIELNNTRSIKAETKQINGRLKTKISYFNSDGSNYSFTIDGGLPVTKGSLFSWVENNYNKYRPGTPSTPPAKIPLQASQWLHWRDILPSECGNYQRNISKITEPIGANPWQVSLGFVGTEDFFCEASIISFKHLLTAAHCFINHHFRTISVISEKDFYVTARRDIYYRNNNPKYTVAYLAIHDHYNPENKVNDIALVMINEVFQWSKDVFPLCLPEVPISHTEKRQCKINEDRKLNASFTLLPEQDFNEELRPYNACSTMEKSSDHLSKSFFFCGKPLGDCRGYLPGAFSCLENGRETLYGIPMFTCCRCGEQYTKVAEYLSFIYFYLEKTTDLISLKPQLKPQLKS